VFGFCSWEGSVGESVEGESFFSFNFFSFSFLYIGWKEMLGGCIGQHKERTVIFLFFFFFLFIIIIINEENRSEMVDIFGNF